MLANGLTYYYSLGIVSQLCIQYRFFNDYNWFFPFLLFSMAMLYEIAAINLMDKNYVGWANYLAPLVMGQATDAALTQELETSFCSTDPKYAKPFAKATFFSDDRAMLAKLSLPTLILQSKHDNLASTAVGEYMAQFIPNSQLEVVDAHGHCLHMTNPSIVFSYLREFVS